MNEKTETVCNYCGARFESLKIYCPECGKLIDNVPSLKKQTLKTINKKRICKGCGSTIESKSLEQCPICNTVLDQIPEIAENRDKKEFGLIFDSRGRKLEPIINKKYWNYKEGIKVFELSILNYVITYILLLSVLIVPDTQSNDPSFITLILEMLPRISLIAYPLYYIISKKHDYSKLGFDSNPKKIIIAFILGIIGSLALLFSNFGMELILNRFISVDSPGFIEYFNNLSLIKAILGSSVIFVIIYLLISSLAIVAVELAYRGVLHRSLRARFGSTIKARSVVVILSSLIYGSIESFFFFPADLVLGVFIFINYIAMFIILGVIYEFKSNLYTTIIAHVLFNTIWVVVFVFF
ncbi:MAG: CPBP family intramembrane metalloprotease [Candidatus Lokiarchaeota archaeon]|nr:CPBP family intramembrane metalloprotease [Candidatus Lokiarchaeota archaeon]